LRAKERASERERERLKQPTLVRCGLVALKLSRNDNLQANGGAGFFLGLRRRRAASTSATINTTIDNQVRLYERNVKKREEEI